MTDREFENFYREHLEEDIIFCLSKRKNIPLDQAMGLYYNSKLADHIHDGHYGIQYLVIPFILFGNIFITYHQSIGLEE